MNKKLRILIVDDEPGILEIMTGSFKSRGYFVSTASSGNEAVEILKNIFFDVIVSDFRMPNGNGMTILNYTNTLNPRPVFFFVSGGADLSVHECIEAGARYFFSKPVDFDMLISEIEKNFYD